MTVGESPEVLLEEWPPVDWDAPGGECATIAEAWADLRDFCLDEDPAALTDMENRLVREWALEVASADRLVEMDRNLAYRLATEGFDDLAGEVGERLEQWEFDVLAGLWDACKWLLEQDEREATLDLDFLTELHGRLSVPETVPVSGGSVRGEVAEHEVTPAVLQQLASMLADQPRHGEAPPALAAAWLLNLICRLRPFGADSDRVARAAASYWLLGAELFPLTLRREDRNPFNEALASAGSEGLEALATVVATTQRRCFLHVVSTLGRVRSEPSDLDDVISVISDQFRSGSAELRRSFAHAANVATEVFWHAKSRISKIEEDLGDAIEDDSGDRRVFADYAPPDHPERRSWHRKQVIDGVRRQGYFANLRNYSAWNRIGLDTPNGRSEILLTFHAVGQSFRGVIAAGLMFYRKRGGEIYDHQVVSREPYQINFRDDIPTACRRFDAWMDPSMRAALEVWRRGE